MFSLERTLPLSPYSTISKFVARLSLLLGALYPANQFYKLNEIESIQDGIIPLFIGACFIFTAWWGARLWARYRTRKYLVMQVMVLSFIAFTLLSQLVSIQLQFHAAVVLVYLLALFVVAFQRGESR